MCKFFRLAMSATTLRGRRGQEQGPKATVARPNRVGCARKACAERAGTVAARFTDGYHGRWSISPAGYPRRANEPCCSAKQAVCPKEIRCIASNTEDRAVTEALFRGNDIIP